ncbi:MAG: transposase [Spirochaetia bacterium]|nr:transposase [Spirochaetia bacterium]
MGVPEHIRSVDRPKNTIVEDSGRDGVNRYSVRVRSAVKYVKGGNPQPGNGRVIGHIIHERFVPITERMSGVPDSLSYGVAALAQSISDDLFDDLLAVYPPNEAAMVMAIAMLKVSRPGIAANRYSTHYGRTFVSKYYPNVAMSRNSVGSLFKRVGMDGAKRKAFYASRIARVTPNHHIAIDGTLKQNTSTVNDLSAFSYKARVKGCKDVSVIYAYVIETMEPLCAEVFPGNSIDASSFSAFINDNNITDGIIVADKGFPISSLAEDLKMRPNLHFISPLKRVDRRIVEHGMLSFDEVVTGTDKSVIGKKVALPDGRYLYAFRDSYRAGMEERSVITSSKKKQSFDSEKYLSHKDKYGLIVFESDLDLSLSQVYQCYENRWLLELLFSLYKGEECLDSTNVQGDYSLIGAEFVNFISTVMTARMVRKAGDAKLLDVMTYGDLMDDLSSAWRQSDSTGTPRSGDKKWVHTLPSVLVLLEKLGLSEPLVKESKKVGRPKKEKAEPEKPKRPRGRPRKNPEPQGKID